MLKQLYALLFVFLSINLIGQTTIIGTVFDIDNQAPISYVNIGLEGESVGTVSTPAGTFSMVIPDSLMNNTIVFSSIGYETYKSTVTKFLKGKNRKHLHINLKPATYAMDEVIVTKSKLKLKTLGIKTTAKNISGGYADDKLGCEIAQKIKLKRKEKVLLDQFYVSINTNSCDSIFFRLNFYEKKGRKPGKNITPVNIIIATDIKEGVINVDLRPYEIWMDDDFFVGLEWIRDFCPENNEEGLKFSGKFFKSLCYKSTSFDKWRKLNIMGIGMWLEVKSNK